MAPVPLNCRSGSGKPYPRNWPAYNAPQIEEKARVEVFLVEVRRGRHPPVTHWGPPPDDFSDEENAVTDRAPAGQRPPRG